MVWRVETCAICEEEFGWEHKGGTPRKTCSDGCLQKHRKEVKRKYRESNREKIRSYQKSYYKKNRDEAIQYAQHYRERLKGGEKGALSDEITSLCEECGRPFSYTSPQGQVRATCGERCRRDRAARLARVRRAESGGLIPGDRADKCIDCGAEFVWEYKSGTKRAYCEKCLLEKRRKYDQLYYRTNKVRILEYESSWRAKNADKIKSNNQRWYRLNRLKKLDQNRKWYIENRYRRLESCKEWRRNNPEKVKEYERNWRSNNPDANRAKVARRRALQSNAFVEPITRRVVLERDEWTCGICGGEIPKGLKWPHPLSPHIDHIIPLSEGGKEEYTNVQAAHASCNMQKGARLDGWQNIKPIVDGEENHYHS